MLIPHNGNRTLNIKVPSVGVFLSVLLWFFGSIYVITIAINTIEYYNMKHELKYYTSQFTELQTTITTLKKAENEFRKLLSLGSKDAILENVGEKNVKKPSKVPAAPEVEALKDNAVNTQDAGSIDMAELKNQIQKSVETVSSIKEFLKRQTNLYHATPKAWPVVGRITSGFGMRENPKNGQPEFHTGLDISAGTGTPVQATADGIVSFAKWSTGSGNLVVIEHGFGFSTFYAHNSSIKVALGQSVKRGEVISFVGATGNTTGPHLHYEVWHNGKAVNPIDFVREAKNVSKAE